METIKTGQAFKIDINSSFLLCVKCSDIEFITEDLNIFCFDDVKEKDCIPTIEYDKEFCTQMLDYYNNVYKRKELKDKTEKLFAERKALDEYIYSLEAKVRWSIYRQKYLSVVAQKAQKTNGNAKIALNLNNHLNKMKIGAIIYKTDRTIKYRSADTEEYDVIGKEKALDIILCTESLRIISDDNDIYIN